MKNVNTVLGRSTLPDIKCLDGLNILRHHNNDRNVLGGALAQRSTD